MNLTTILLLAATIFSEAGLEPPEGRRMVADAIYWRAKGRPENLRQVVLAPSQFSCWNPGKYRRATHEALAINQRRNGPVWRDCVRLAKELASGTYAPQSRRNHYYNPLLCRPYWAPRLVNTKKIGRHIAGQLP